MRMVGLQSPPVETNDAFNVVELVGHVNNVYFNIYYLNLLSKNILKSGFVVLRLPNLLGV